MVYHHAVPHSDIHRCCHQLDAGREDGSDFHQTELFAKRACHRLTRKGLTWNRLTTSLSCIKAPVARRHAETGPLYIASTCVPAHRRPPRAALQLLLDRSTPSRALIPQLAASRAPRSPLPSSTFLHTLRLPAMTDPSVQRVTPPAKNCGGKVRGVLVKHWTVPESTAPSSRTRPRSTC